MFTQAHRFGERLITRFAECAQRPSSHLRLPRFVLLNRQFLPLSAEVQELQNVVEDRIQRELRLRATAADVQMGQDKLLKLV